MLSPLAAPFKPTRAGYTEFASFAAIYNDGVPEGIVCGRHADHFVLHNIPDEAIDEIFPPDASDAAELDAADEFLAAMVDLSFLEEREEMTRSDYGHTLQKRWEARRQNGLVGKPHTASMDKHHLKGHQMMSPGERSLTRRHHRFHSNLENKRCMMEAQKRLYMCNRQKKLVKGYTQPIIQPRKIN